MLSDWSAVLNVSTEAACGVPSGLSVTNVTTSSADLSWNAETSATSGYQYVVMLDGVAPNPATAEITATTANTSVQISGLTDGIGYDVYVRSDCGSGDLSNWSSVSSFSTLEVCVTPSNISVACGFILRFSSSQSRRFLT